MTSKLAMDETNNSKSTVKSSLPSQDQTFHMNILLGSEWGDSLNSYLEFDMIIGKRESTSSQSTPVTSSVWQTLEPRGENFVGSCDLFEFLVEPT